MDETGGILDLIQSGGPALWAIVALSVVGLATIIWKVSALLRLGAWRVDDAEPAVAAWIAGDAAAARHVLGDASSARARVARAAFDALISERFGEAGAREETERVGRAILADARSGLRALDLVATLAPLLGLLGTVLGMIAAFRALEVAGTTADPATLAGGIWEALLTTAAGMAVAIPAGAAAVWFEGVTERLAADLEDMATRIFLQAPPARRSAAE